MSRVPQGIHLNKPDQFNRRGYKITNEQNNYAPPQQQQPAQQQAPVMPQMQQPQAPAGRDAMVAQNIQFNMERRRRAQEYSTALQQNQAAKIAAAKSAGYGGANTGGVSQFIGNSRNPALQGQAAQFDQATAHNMTLPDFQGQQANILAQQNTAGAIATNAQAGLNTSLGNLAAGEGKKLSGQGELTQATGNVADQVGTLPGRLVTMGADAAQKNAAAGFQTAETNFLTQQGGKVATPGMVMPASMTTSPYKPEPKNPFTPKDQAETNKIIAETDAIKNGLDPETKAKISAAQSIIGVGSTAGTDEKNAAYTFLKTFLGGGAAQSGASTGKIRVSNGTSTLEIDAADLAHAEKDGFKRIN